MNIFLPSKKDWHKRENRWKCPHNTQHKNYLNEEKTIIKNQSVGTYALSGTYSRKCHYQRIVQWLNYRIVSVD